MFWTFPGFAFYYLKKLGASQTVSIAIKQHKGRCAECGLHFNPEDLIEIHHLDGNYRNNRRGNLTATHRHCHNPVHGGSSNLATQLSTYNKGQFGEEPTESNLSRPVLKPSRVGDHLT